MKVCTLGNFRPASYTGDGEITNGVMISTFKSIVVFSEKIKPRYVYMPPLRSLMVQGGTRFLRLSLAGVRGVRQQFSMPEHH